jgi:hypothetical protein
MMNNKRLGVSRYKTYGAKVARALGALILSSALSPAAFAWQAPPDKNYAKCLLDEMPGAANATVAFAISRRCLARYPAGLQEISRGIGTQQWFSFKSPEECIIKKAAGTTDPHAARLIGIACHCLFGTWMNNVFDNCAEP